MEYRKRSLWNRIWENDSLESLSEEVYVRDVYGEKDRLPWKAVIHGTVMSVWKGIQWLFTAIHSPHRENEHEQGEQKECIELKEKIEKLDIAEDPFME